VANKEPSPVGFLRQQGENLEPTLLAALRAYDEIRARGDVADTTLAPVVAAASDRSVLTRDCVTGLLALLAGSYPLARNAIREMSCSPKWHVRFASLLTLDCAPKGFSCDVVRRLLSDKSVRVREMAAAKALRCDLRELIADLEAAALSEANALVVRGLQFSVAMLRDGYLVQPGEKSGFWVTVWLGNGARGQWYSASDFQSRDLTSLVREVRGVA